MPFAISAITRNARKELILHREHVEGVLCLDTKEECETQSLQCQPGNEKCSGEIKGEGKDEQINIFR